MKHVTTKELSLWFFMLNKEFWVLSPEIAVVIQGPGSVYNDYISGFAFIIFKPLYYSTLCFVLRLYYEKSFITHQPKKHQSSEDHQHYNQHRLLSSHYNDVIMRAMASQISGVSIVYWRVAQIKENAKVPRHWLLCGEFIRDQWIPRTKGQ